MAEFKKIFSRIQLVKRSSGKLTVIMIVIAIVLSMGALTALYLSKTALENRTADLRDKAAHLEAENAELEEDINQVDSVQGLVEIAEEELGLVQPDTIFFKPES